MEDNLTKVTAWLKDCCLGDSSNVNVENLSSYLDLMQKNNEQEQNAKLIMDQLKRETLEYIVDDVNIGDGLSQSGLSVELFDKNASRYLHSLSIAANELRIHKPNKANFLIAISNLNQELDDLTSIQTDLNFKLETLQEDIPSLEKQKQHLEKVWEGLEENVASEKMQADKKIKSLKFSTRKLQQNDKETTFHNDKLKLRGFDEKFSRQNISIKQEQFLQLKEESDALNLELEAYQGLPPNIRKAREELKKKNNEYLENENEFIILLSRSVKEDKTDEDE